MKIAVWGAGQMGGALVRGWLRAGVAAAPDFRIYGPHPEKLAAFAAEGCHLAGSPGDALTGADLLLIAVKPHLVVPLLTETPITDPACLVVSVAAGVRLQALQDVLLPESPVIRVMPNTPALVGEAASAFCRGANTSDSHAEIVTRLFGAVGRIFEVTEPQIDAVIGVAGSASAYFYLIIEALSDGGVRAGLPREIARTLAAQTALGAAKMVLETGLHPAVLKDAVTTPGGTTITALATLEKAGVRSALIEAVQAAADRARSMG